MANIFLNKHLWRCLSVSLFIKTHTDQLHLSCTRDTRFGICSRLTHIHTKMYRIEVYYTGNKNIKKRIEKTIVVLAFRFERNEEKNKSFKSNKTDVRTCFQTLYFL